MNRNEPPIKESSERKSNARRLIVVVVVATLAILGVSIYVEYHTAQCAGFVCGPPVDEPVILNAFVNQSSAKTDCGIVTQGYPQAVVCDVTISGGVSGTVVLSLTSRGGDSKVAFGTYSTESQYVQFTSTYSCQYSSGPPDYNTARCPVSTAGSIYRINYTVSQSLSAPKEAILIIVVTKTCCWP